MGIKLYISGFESRIRGDGRVGAPRDPTEFSVPWRSLPSTAISPRHSVSRSHRATVCVLSLSNLASRQRARAAWSGVLHGGANAQHVWRWGCLHSRVQ